MDFHPDRGVERLANQHLHPGEQLVDVHDLGLEDLLAGVGEQPPGQLGGAGRRRFGLGDPALQPLVFLRRALDQLQVAEDHGQQVVEVVRDAARQLTDRLHLLRLQQVRRTLGRVATVDVDVLAGRDRDQLEGERAVAQRELDLLRLVGCDALLDQRVQGRAQRQRAAVVEQQAQRLGDPVGVEHAAIGRDADHRVRVLVGEPGQLLDVPVDRFALGQIDTGADHVLDGTFVIEQAGARPADPPALSVLGHPQALMFARELRGRRTRQTAP